MLFFVLFEKVKKKRRKFFLFFPFVVA